jgi:hypothetical protein
MNRQDEWIALANEFSKIDPYGFLAMAWGYDSPRNRYSFSFKWLEPRVYLFDGERPSFSRTEAKFKAYSAKAAEALDGIGWQIELWFGRIRDLRENELADKGLVAGVCAVAEELCHKIASDPESYTTRTGILDRVLSSPPHAVEEPVLDEASDESTEPCCRKAEVDAFIAKCREISGQRILKSHIWRSVGHTKARQFEYWQSCDKKTTASDSTNFKRILRQDPMSFVESLKGRGLLS